MKNINYKKLLPYLAAILVFLTITFAYLSPILEGKVFNQTDTVLSTATAKEIIDFRKAHPNEEPLWTNTMFGGMPAYVINMITPSTNIIAFFDNAMRLFSLPNPANLIFIYFIG